MGNKREPSVDGGVYIPTQVLLNSDINLKAKVTWGLVFAVAGEDGTAMVTNEWLAERLNVNPRTVQNYLNDLQDAGLLEKEIQREGALSVDEIRVLIPYQGGEDTFRGRVRARSLKHNYATAAQCGTENYDKESSKSVSNNAEIKEIFEFWRTERQEALDLEKTSVQLTEGRKQAIQDRLKEGYSPDDIKQAILGCLGNEWNRDRGFVDISLICRNSEKLEQYMRWFENEDSGDRKQDPSEKEMVGSEDVLADISDEIDRRRGS